MKVRGERECRDCETRWSYYETGSVECPDCGSLKSVGVADRALHTDSPAELDLTPHREAFGDARGTLPAAGVDDLKDDLREYVRKRGFVSGGALLVLDDTYLAARELLEAVDAYDRQFDPTDADREYLLALLSTADDGERPPAAGIPESMRDARGLAAARAAAEYREDVESFLDDAAALPEDADPEADDPAVSKPDVAARADAARDRLERLRDRTKRVEALQGDVAPDVADALVEAARAVGAYVRDGDDEALARADEQLTDAEL